MEVTTVTDILSNFGFPIAIVIILLLFLAKVLKSYKDSTDAQKEDIKELNKQYHEDFAKITEALNNNTNAIASMNKLLELIARGRCKFTDDDEN